ncbi:MAG: carboxylesterase/lipase family protein [Gemmatimonadales bacterium]
MRREFLPPAITALAMLLGACMTATPDPLLRTTTSGPVGGVVGDASTYQWLGIPYAAPPIGARRWRPPEPPEAWTALRTSREFGPACPQIAGVQGPGPDGRSYGPGVEATFGTVVGDEDCITLNLWRPASGAEELPVVVFVHGGANVVGYSGDPLYHGARLAAALDAVVVSLNYRLGLFGFFHHPALSAGADSATASGNFGLLDLIEGLRWVARNAAGFGGDPDNVTLIGQSAGAVNALGLMTSPLAEGLFERVVALSGALLSSPIEAQQRYAERVARAALADGATSDSAAGALRAASAEQLVRAAAGIEGGGLATADGFVLPRDPVAVVASGGAHGGPLIVGVTRDEGTFFVPQAFRSEAERFRLMMRADSVSLEDLLTPALLEEGAFESLAAGMTRVVTDLVERSLDLFAGRSAPTYAMRFDWSTSREPWRTVIGASHAMELPFLLGNFGRHYFHPTFVAAERPGREALSAAMQSALARFVRSGDPNGPGLPAEWPRYDVAAPHRLVWDADASETRIAIR